MFVGHTKLLKKETVGLCFFEVHETMRGGHAFLGLNEFICLLLLFLNLYKKMKTEMTTSIQENKSKHTRD